MALLTVAAIEELEQQYREAVSRLQNLQQRLGAIADKSDPRRVPIKNEIEVAETAIRDLKQQVKKENTRRHYAGMGSPLHEACLARFGPDVVAELEVDAVARQAERDAKAADRRARGAAGSSTAPSLTIAAASITQAPKVADALPKPARRVVRSFD